MAPGQSRRNTTGSGRSTRRTSSAYFRGTQPEAWEKFSKQYPADPEKALLDSVARQLSKADPNATGKALRRYGTLGVLRHPFKDRGATIRLAQFKPDHDLNPDTMARYAANRLRVVPELVYSPYANYKDADGTKGRKWRIDLVLFLNGIPVATLELKSEFKQACKNAVTQYKKDRPPKDPGTGKPEPLLTFKRGAIVHFAVSQYEVEMCTKLAGFDSYFLPFNKGTAEGAAGNDVPEDGGHATAYLWEEVLERENLLTIIGRYIHLEVKETTDWEGRRSKKETLIFPRYHQWDVVRKLVAAARVDGAGGEVPRPAQRRIWKVELYRVVSTPTRQPLPRRRRQTVQIGHRRHRPHRPRRPASRDDPPVRA